MSVFPEGDEDADGLTRAQQRWLLLASVGLGALLLVLVLGLTAASHYYGAGGGIDGQPDSSFSIESVEQSDGLAANVTHRGGHAVHPDNVVVEVDGERRGNWSALGGEGADVVARGHSLVVSDVEAGEEVRVVWTGRDDDGDEEAVVLARDTV